MSDLENPYNSPETPIVPEKIQSAGNLTEIMLRYLREASPWLRFVGILGFIASGVIAVFGIVTIIFSNLLIGGILSEFGASSPLWLASLLYIGMGAIYFIPSFFTYNFGTKIKRYQYSSLDDDLEQALKNNKSLWKFTGILYIVLLALLPFMIIIGIIAGIAAVSGIF